MDVEILGHHGRLFFWNPSKLGLASIPKKYVDRTQDPVPIPREMLNPNGPLYRRVGKVNQAISALQRSEEALNDIFDITFAILADELKRELLFRPAGLRTTGQVMNVGKNLDLHFQKPMHNVTQHDGFYTTHDAILALEMKLADDTRLEQIAKYAFLMNEEEIRSGKRQELGLLFLVPHSRKARFEERYVGRGPALTNDIVERAIAQKSKKRVDQGISEAPEHFQEILSRIKFSVLTWSELAASLEGIISRTDCATAEGETLVRLLSGLHRQICEHGGSEVKTTEMGERS